MNSEEVPAKFLSDGSTLAMSFLNFKPWGSGADECPLLGVSFMNFKARNITWHKYGKY